MPGTFCGSDISWRSVLYTLAAIPLLSVPLLRTSGWAQSADLLPSWNDRAANHSIIAFVQATTDASGKKFFPQEARVAAFEEGRLWVEHPMYSQVMYCLDLVPVLEAERAGSGSLSKPLLW
jgi:hypothetical protein